MQAAPLACAAVRRLGGLGPFLDRAAGLAETRRAAFILFLVALGAWWLEALIIPLGPGRDFGTYLGAYAQLFQAHPIDLGYVLGRTPGAPLVVGSLLDFAGGALAEPVVSVLYASSVTAWFIAARSFGGRAALFVAVVLITFPGYGLLFHELSSDAVFAAAFAGWSLLAVRVLRSPSPWRVSLLGFGVGALVLIRPGSQILLLLTPLALALRGSWRIRVVSAFAFAVPVLIIVGGWTLQNGVRYDDYTLARGANSGVPFYRAFVTDHIVRPGNGPASRRLAQAVQRELLPREPYKSYGVDLHEFFAEASPRMHEDLVALSNRLWGWKSDAAKLRQAGIEAVRTHPLAYARGVVTTTWQLLRQPLFISPRLPASSKDGAEKPARLGAEPIVVINGRRLPRPTEGEPIPAAHEGGVATPDNSIHTVWTSPSEHHLVFDHPADERRYRALHERIDQLAGNLPHRRGNAQLALRLNQSSRWYPPPVVWLLLGLLALLVRRPPVWPLLSVPAVAALLVIAITALAVPAAPQYSIPVAPAFVLLAAGGLFAKRRAPVGDTALVRSRWRTKWASIAGVATAIVAATWAIKVYFDKIRGSFDAGQPPHDLEVFLRAAGNLVHGTSLYAFNGDQTFAYPPLLAFVAAPFEPLSAGVATLLWMLLSLAAIAGALWLLGVRDWRCYALTAVLPFTRSAVGLGTVGPLLLLAVAVAWRWREQVGATAAAAGAAVALKLFLWPLLIWLALTGRFRAALAGVGFALVFALLPWAVIGFAGIGDYPDVLRRLSDDEATSSYSLVAIAVRAHLPEVAGVVLSGIVALALLAAAAWMARHARRPQRDRDVAVLTLALVAALAASPIVWVHYFLLLLVPLALTRPSLSALWFVPLAYYPLGETAWPAGDARKLGLALLTTSVLVMAAVGEGSDEPWYRLRLFDSLRSTLGRRGRPARAEPRRP